jgi:hypothetical protein
MDDFAANHPLERAVQLLGSDPGLRILQVRSYDNSRDRHHHHDDDEPDDDGLPPHVREARRWVQRQIAGQLADALEMHRGISDISFHGCVFDDELTEPSLDRLFGIVLPNHKTLTRISFMNCEIVPHYVQLLTAALAAGARASKNAISRPSTARGSTATRTVTTPATTTFVSSLSFTMVPLSRESVKAIAQMVRDDAPTLLRLSLVDCDLDSVDAKLLCDGLASNNTLQALELEDVCVTAHADTLVHAVAPTSPLREISLDFVRWTLEGISTFFTALRTNRTLERIIIARPSMGRQEAEMPLWEQLFDQLLTDYNFTIRRIEPFASGTNRFIATILASNDSVRLAHDNLARTGYQVTEKSAWPEVLDRISCKPALIQHFLRRGNVAAFASHLQEVYYSHQHQRGRRLFPPLRGRNHLENAPELEGR